MFGMILCWVKMDYRDEGHGQIIIQDKVNIKQSVRDVIIVHLFPCFIPVNTLPLYLVTLDCLTLMFSVLRRILKRVRV